MWLTQTLMAVRRFRSSRWTPGRQFIGKHRKFRPVTDNMVKNVIKRLEIEKENESYLTTPYLTKAEEKGHAREQNYREFGVLIEQRRHAKMKPHRYLEDHLSHLNHSRRW